MEAQEGLKLISLQSGRKTKVAFKFGGMNLLHPATTSGAASLDKATIFVESEKESMFTLYIDEAFQGEAGDHHHTEGPATFHFSIGKL